MNTALPARGMAKPPPPERKATDKKRKMSFAEWLSDHPAATVLGVVLLLLAGGVAVARFAGPQPLHLRSSPPVIDVPAGAAAYSERLAREPPPRLPNMPWRLPEPPAVTSDSMSGMASMGGYYGMGGMNGIYGMSGMGGTGDSAADGLSGLPVINGMSGMAPVITTPGTANDGNTAPPVPVPPDPTTINGPIPVAPLPPPLPRARQALLLLSAPPPPSQLPTPAIAEIASSPVLVPGATLETTTPPLWQRNAVATHWPPNRPAIVIIIDDLGLDRKRSARAVSLPAPLTLAWLPYATELGRQTQAARTAGHELLLHAPMEPENGEEDPGPGALTTKLAVDDVLSRFAAQLTAFEGYIGVNNHMGSRFTADRNHLRPVLTELHKRGLVWVDSKTTNASAGPSLAQELGLPHAARDVFLDHDPSLSGVRASLVRLEQVARQTGVGIGIGHPLDTTLTALADWLPSLPARGLTLVPVSAVIRARQSAAPAAGSAPASSRLP